MRVFLPDSNLSYISGRRMSPVEGVGVAAGVGVSVGPGVAVGDGVSVGSGVVVASGVSVGSGVAVGDDVSVGSGVAVGAGVSVGSGVTVGAGVSVGSGVTVASGVFIGSGVGFAIDCIAESSDDSAPFPLISLTVIARSPGMSDGPQAASKEIHMSITKIMFNFFIICLVYNSREDAFQFLKPRMSSRFHFLLDIWKNYFSACGNDILRIKNNDFDLQVFILLHLLAPSDYS